MKTKFALAVMLAVICSIKLSSQGFGIGYMIDIGEKSKHSYADSYSQYIQSITHNGFIRYHNPTGKRSFQLQVGFRTDSIEFENYSEFLNIRTNTMDAFDVEAYLKRQAWRVGMLYNVQMGKRPGKFIFAIQAGLFYEYTQSMTRFDPRGERTYRLNDEINKHNLIFQVGPEIRFSWFTIGYKIEHMMFDMLDHSYINGQNPGHNNSTELRGLKLNPTMGMFYMGINIDIFRRQE